MGWLVLALVLDAALTCAFFGFVLGWYACGDDEEAS